MEGIRSASHAGSWYVGSTAQLNTQLNNWLSQAEISQPQAKVIIGPHAGYAYSGPTAAWAYKHINPSTYNRVFLLGPSHHVYIPGCALPCSAVYETPLGNLPIDEETVSELANTQKFARLTLEAEEEEHSLEMHMPYIRKVFENKDIRLVPIMVGNLKNKAEEDYGKLLAPFLRDPATLFVVSSDFCHWGSRFGFTPYDRSKGEIHQSIEAMDREGMRLIEQQNPEGFQQYLKDTDNTICGRHPIAVTLFAMRHSGLNFQTRFVRYAQSENVTNPRGSSVSYAAGVSSVNE